MSAYNQRLRRIEAAAGDLPRTVKDMTDAKLIRLITGGDCSQYITDAELKRIANESEQTNGRD